MDSPRAQSTTNKYLNRNPSHS
uniref:Uncharacterized protein n=1 Tax=Arundo donax TaxID=35708 RepID=A0A0A9H9K4_ARUDO